MHTEPSLRQRKTLESSLKPANLLLLEADSKPCLSTLGFTSDLLCKYSPVHVNELQALPSSIVDNSPAALLVSSETLTNALLQCLLGVLEHTPIPIAVCVRMHNPLTMKAALRAGVAAYIVDEVQIERLPVIIELAMERFEQWQTLRSQLKATELKLAERKLIEKAKGILMQQKRLSEAEAYAQMRRSAMNQGESLGRLAQNMIDVFEMLD